MVHTKTTRLVTSDLTGKELKRYIEVDQSLMGGPTRHFRGGAELAAYILTESPNRKIILELLDEKYGIGVRVRYECQYQDCRCSE